VSCRSSTLLKMVPVLRRHQDMFFDKSQIIPREKPLIIHSERYQVSSRFCPSLLGSANIAASNLLRVSLSKNQNLRIN